MNGNDVYLENIVVVKKADQAKPPAAGDAIPRRNLQNINEERAAKTRQVFERRAWMRRIANLETGVPGFHIQIPTSTSDFRFMNLLSLLFVALL